jgi:hypothetical protein
MEELDRSIAQAERSYEQIRHNAAESELYARFKERWNDYRKTVNQMLALSRTNRKAEAIAIYLTSSRSAYNAASDTLGLLTDRAVANAQEASARLAAAYRQALWLVALAMAIAGVMVVGALFYISRSAGAGTTLGFTSAEFRIDGLPRVPYAVDHHRRPRPTPD